ncbi:MAG: T9SS type A sorting domain-containing protein, partial [Muribaculaceae bacterium]|nr:T9SS type A sorting domain-containing protein [Muribaculaceae bacterium]
AAVYKRPDMGVYPFWLFSAGETKWEKDNSVIANTPYLIAMPNNPQYADEYVVKGDVIFKSTNASVSVTPTEEDMKHAFGVGRYVVGNYTRICVDEGKLAINEFAATYQNQDYMPGGIFISNERDVAPFECYVESQGAKGIPVFDSSAVDELIGDCGTYIWSESYSICIRSSIAMKIRIYDMVGQLIRIVDVKAGETVRVDDMTPGIYFVGTTKILVKG